ncbi:hypothetical protein THRCLA_21392 [Thraustotheca clavata]|uniref:Uncharacterized protein n=1 Tax=Thraustotheca clavata TaxID=74557 RepID=A0A1V9ZX18_9STRA|nr:hypothetical protein THRCLA_21392 [Thraustotheca clavata]
MVPLAEIIVSCCLIVSVFIFGLLIDLEAQRRLAELQHPPAINISNPLTPKWSTTMPKDACFWQETSQNKAQKVEFPGSLYFRSICETGSDAPSLTLKAKSLSCRLWQQLEAYLEAQLASKDKPQHTCVKKYPKQAI